VRFRPWCLLGNEMKPGAKPVPTALKILMGNPGKRPLNEHEPKPAPGIPDRPEHLDDLANRIWDRTIPVLERMGVLTEIDGDVVESYCVARSEWYRASKFIRENGQTYTSKDSEGRVLAVHPWPQVSIVMKYWQIVRWCAAELGMTPSSRTRIRTEPFAQVDEFEAFLNEDRSA